MENVTHTTLVQVTAKGARHNPRPSAMDNHLSWGAVLEACKGGKPAKVGDLIEAIQAANPENKGNAPGYIRYMLRNGHLAAAKAEAKAK